MNQKRRIEYEKMLEYEKIYESDNEEDLEAFYGLPKQIKFCSKCVISNQRPASVVEFQNTIDSKKPVIDFDENDVCSACKYTEMKDKEIDWKDRENQLKALLDQIRSKDGNYDCIVPGSGGKDSMFASHLLKYKYKMHPLTVTWPPHIYTEIGWKNFQTWLRAGYDNITFRPNERVHRLLTRLAFENLLHPFQPFIIGQKSLAPKLAIKLGIPIIFYGESGAEYGNSLKSDYHLMDDKFFKQPQDLSKIYLGGVSAKELIDSYGVELADLNPYIPPKA